MWNVYNDILDSIPDHLTVVDCMVGLHWTLVRSEQGTGAAMTLKGGREGSPYVDIVGMPLRQLAASIKSWNMVEASLGQAAVNSALNHPTNVSVLSGKPFERSADAEEANGFARFLPVMEGKNVAVIGHFPNINSLKDHCRLSILERTPQADDYPDPACEYILPQQDLVFITGTALINKTMPRLLALSEKAQVILVGPSVPITPVLFEYGVDTIASTVLLDEELVWKVAKQGGKKNIFRYGGQMVSISRDELITLNHSRV